MYKFNILLLQLIVQNLRGQITQLIRQSNKMSLEADELDTKIGLLIQNRISLQVYMVAKTNYVFCFIFCCKKIMK